MSKDKLYIIGAGSVGGHIARNITAYSEHFEIAGFFDDDPQKIGSELYNYPVLGPVSNALSLENEAVIIGIAFPEVKKKLVEILFQNLTLKFPALVHGKAWISNEVSVGMGSVIYPGTSVNYGSMIGDHVLINMNCALGHHTVVENFSSLAPGVNTGGHSTIQECVDVGIGVSTLQNVTIGSGSIIGGQAFVNRDIPSDSKAVGVPARAKKK